EAGGPLQAPRRLAPSPAPLLVGCRAARGARVRGRPAGRTCRIAGPLAPATAGGVGPGRRRGYPRARAVRVPLLDMGRGVATPWRDARTWSADGLRREV